MDSTNVFSPVHFDASRLSHAYITSGSLADEIANVAVCSGFGGAVPCMTCTHCGKATRRTHPDIVYVNIPKDKREIVVDQIRDLKEDVIIVPNEAGKKAYIINDADLMNINAQNALLQILEEPPSHALFILRTQTPAALLRTVRSRCVELMPLPEAGTPDPAAEEMANAFFSALAGGNLMLASFMFQLEKLDKDTLAGFLAAAQERAALMLRAASAAGDPIDCRTIEIPVNALAQMERILARAETMLHLNVSTGHISGMICASFIETSD